MDDRIENRSSFWLLNLAIEALLRDRVEPDEIQMQVELQLKPAQEELTAAERAAETPAAREQRYQAAKEAGERTAKRVALDEAERAAAERAAAEGAAAEGAEAGRAAVKAVTTYTRAADEHGDMPIKGANEQ